MTGEEEEDQLLEVPKKLIENERQYMRNEREKENDKENDKEQGDDHGDKTNAYEGAQQMKRLYNTSVVLVIIGHFASNQDYEILGAQNLISLGVIELSLLSINTNGYGHTTHVGARPT